MATLGECKTCGVKVSDEAIACPHCGQPNPYTAPDPDRGPWSVVLIDAGAEKINVIKVVREMTALGLKESQNLVENLPQTLKRGLSRPIAERLKNILFAAGANSEIQ